jgi:methenyltetrahydrofolate cyclohydrolase
LATDYLDLKIREFLDLSASEPAPGAGSAAAIAIALAASLVTKVARSSPTWNDAAGVAAQALELQDRCPALARDDDEAWRAAVNAIRDHRGDAAVATALERAADLPLAIAETGADVATLARLAAERGDVDLRSEAVAAAILAHAGVRSAAHLVAINLSTRAESDRSSRAAVAERAAAASVSAIVELE